MSDLSGFGSSAAQQAIQSLDSKAAVAQLDAIFLDCDGTLVMNAEEIHEACVEKTLHTFYISAGLDFDEETLTRFKQVWTAGLGKGIAPFYNEFVKTMPLADAFALGKVCAGSSVFEAAYEHDYIHGDAKKMAVVRTGMKQLVQAANDVGVPVAIVSNAKQDVLQATVDAAGFGDKVQLVIGKDTIEAAGFKTKPDGGSYECARQRLQVISGKQIDMAKSLGAEDTKTGLQSLEDAGVGVRIWCNNQTEVHSFDEPEVPVTAVSKLGGNILSDLVNSIHLAPFNAGNDNSVAPGRDTGNDPSPK